MSWFRMYVEAMDDPKVMQLDPKVFRAWVVCLCLAKEGNAGDGVIPSASVVAFKLHVTESAAAKYLKELNERGLIDVSGNVSTPHNWSARQYKSDVSTSRVQRFRNRQNAVSRNDNETFQKPPQSTEYRVQSTDIPQTPTAALPLDLDPIPLTGRDGLFDIEPPPSKPKRETMQREWFDQWWTTVWLKVGKDGAWSKFKQKITTLELFEKVVKQTELQGPGFALRERDKQPHPETWLNKGRYLDEDSALFQAPRSQADSWDVV